MSYTNLREIERQRALAQQLRGQDFKRGSTLSGLAHVIRQYGAGRADYLANQKEQENARIESQAMSNALKNPDGIDYSALTSSGVPELNKLALTLRMKEQSNDARPPANIQEWQAYQQMTPDEQGQFLRMKRADRVINLGDRQVVPNQVDPSKLSATYDIKVSPNESPVLKGQQEAAKQAAQTAAIVPKAEQEATATQVTAPAQAEAAAQMESAKSEAKATSEQVNQLADMRANMPKLEKLVKELSVLGEDATYTYAGQAMDFLGRQVGFEPSDGAVARTEYTARLDNEVLPLLRQTFGAAFTVEEGNKLRATLGDENLSPREKNAQLKAFIESKRSQIESLERRTGQPSQVQPAPATGELSPAEQRELEELRKWRAEQ